jgi:hypothetical protein
MASDLLVPAKVLVGPLLSALGDGYVECFVHLDADHGFHHEIKFVGNSSAGICGVTDIHLTGPFDSDEDAAMRACLLCTLVAIRDKYGIFVGDYSFSKVVGSHKMFLKVQSRIDTIYCEFRKTKNAALKFLRCLNEFMVGAHVHGLRQAYDKISDALACAATELLNKVNEANAHASSLMKLGSIDNDPVSFFRAVGNDIVSHM